MMIEIKCDECDKEIPQHFGVDTIICGTCFEDANVEELKKQEEEIERLEGLLEESDQKNDNLNEEINYLNGEIEEIESVRNDLKAADKKIDRLMEQVEELGDEMKAEAVRGDN
jgi:septal ring factor EnvC (AmiA/AmiB activator)